jgi:hypothetical protein
MTKIFRFMQILKLPSEQSKHNEVKGIKEGIKYFARPYMVGRACVCVSVCLCVCVSVLKKKLYNFWWIEQILMKFSGLVEQCILDTNAGKQ